MPGMDEVLQFLRAFVDAEFQVRRASYAEPDDRKLQQLTRALDAMYAGDLASGQNRPTGDPPGFYDQPEQVAAAAKQQPRTIFAVAHYKHGKSDLYRAWLGDTEPRRRGESMRQNIYVAKDAGELKIVARYLVCSSCQGAGTVAGGARCDACDGTGWLFRGGTQWKVLGPLLEVRKLQAPSDPLSQPAYAAIEEPS